MPTQQGPQYCGFYRLGQILQTCGMHFGNHLRASISALWMVGGPIFFSLLALGIYENYRRRTAVSLVVSEG